MKNCIYIQIECNHYTTFGPLNFAGQLVERSTTKFLKIAYRKEKYSKICAVLGQNYHHPNYDVFNHVINYTLRRT